LVIRSGGRSKSIMHCSLIRGGGEISRRMNRGRMDENFGTGKGGQVELLQVLGKKIVLWGALRYAIVSFGVEKSILKSIQEQREGNRHAIKRTKRGGHLTRGEKEGGSNL